MKSRKYIILWAAVVLALGLLESTGAFRLQRDKLVDLLFTRQAPPRDVVIVAIDEKSFARIGQWPWPRTVFAQAIGKLQRASVIGIDVNFKEPSRLGAADDAALATALDRSAPPVVLTAELAGNGSPIPLAAALVGHGRAGYANLLLAPDGVARDTRFSRGSQSSFAALVAEEHRKHATGRGFSIIPGGETRINYLGPGGTFPSVSLSDVLDGTADPSLFDGNIALIGATVIDLQDFHETPIGLMSGVEIQGSIAETLLTQSFYESSSAVTLASVVILAALVIWLAAHLERFRTFAVSIAGIIVAYNLAAFASFDRLFILDLFYPNLAILASAGAAIGLQYFTTTKEKRFIHDSFSRYLAPQVIHQLMHDPSRLALGGKKERLTILFSDIRNFTSLSEGMEPEHLTKFLNDYLGRMTDIVLERNGVIDKYIGDAIMAFWGAPLVNEHHALDAVIAALRMADTLGQFNRDRAVLGDPAIEIGIGLNSGDATVGNMGSEKRFDYTAMGDSVNLASRLEGLTKTYGVTIIISEVTAALLAPEQKTEHGIMLRELDRVLVKGKKNAVTIFEVIPTARQAAIARIKESFDRARIHYYRGAWQEAINAFEVILKECPDDGPSLVLKDRCSGFLHRPAENWHGVFEMTSK